MIGQRGQSVHKAIPAYLWDKGDSHFLFLIYHHPEINNQSIKPTFERSSYISHDSSISSRDPHLLTVPTRLTAAQDNLPLAKTSQPVHEVISWFHNVPGSRILVIPAFSIAFLYRR